MTKLRTLIHKIISEKNLTAVFCFLCTAFFFLLTYYSLGSTYENGDIVGSYMDEYPYLRSDSMLENILLLFLLLLFLWAVTKAITFLSRKCPVKFTMDMAAGIISIAAIAFGIYWVRASGTVPQWDQMSICNSATAFNEGDFSDLLIGGYVSIYRQQLGLVTFLRLLFLVCGNNNYMACQYCSAVLAGGIVFFCYQITKSLSNDNHTAECIYLLLAIFCAPLYFYIPFVYGEIPSTAFIALCTWMLLDCLTIKKVSPLKLILLGLSGGIAIQLRRNTLLFIIGFFIVLLIRLAVRCDKRVLLSAFALLAGILLFQGMIHFMYADKIPANSEALPASLHIAMGTNDDILPGWYNNYHLDVFYACDLEAAWANEVAWQTIKEFIHKCREDHPYTIDFFTRKIASQWNAPMYQCLVMNNCIAYEQYPLAESIYFGRMRHYVEAFMNIYQLLVYGSILFLLYNMRKVWTQIEKYAPLIGIFGGFLFSMIWEAKTRYVFPYFIMMLPYAALGVYCLYRRAAKDPAAG